MWRRQQTDNSQSTLADLDCGFSRPAAADRPGPDLDRGFPALPAPADLDCGFSRPAGIGAGPPGPADLDCGFPRPAAVARRGTPDISLGFQWYAINFMRISVVRHKFGGSARVRPGWRIRIVDFPGRRRSLGVVRHKFH